MDMLLVRGGLIVMSLVIVVVLASGSVGVMLRRWGLMVVVLVRALLQSVMLAGVGIGSRVIVHAPVLGIARRAPRT